MKPLIYSLSFLTLLILLTSCSREGPPSEIVNARKPQTLHMVKEGETTLSISQKYGMREDELIKLNNLKVPFKLIKGQRLKVKPGSGATENPMAMPASQEETEVSVQTVEPAQEGDVVSDPSPQQEEENSNTNGPVPGSEISTTTEGNTALSAAPAPTEGALTVPAQTQQTPISTASYSWPVEGGKVIQTFGQKLKDGSLSEGINIAAPKGTPVKAASAGVVKDAGKTVPAYGNMIVVKQEDGKMAIYAHLNGIDKAVKKGQTISKSQVLGTVGDTGTVAGRPQLHFQVRSAPPSLKPVDPQTLLP
jgi:murein DD-endopeptidase MepM/ murein hydrolase activator NlpD